MKKGMKMKIKTKMQLRRKHRPVLARGRNAEGDTQCQLHYHAMHRSL